MPDADIMHVSLSPKYRSAYQQICEWAWSKEYIGHSALKALRKDLQIYGNEPITLIGKFSYQLDNILSQPLFLPLTDWPSLKNYLELQKRQIHGNKRGLEIAAEACKLVIEKIKGGNDQFYPTKERIISEYLLKIYRARFEEPIILIQNHHLNTPHEIVLERLSEIRQPVEKGICVLASQAANGRKVKSLKLPEDQNRKKIQLDDNVLSL